MVEPTPNPSPREGSYNSKSMDNTNVESNQLPSLGEGLGVGIPPIIQVGDVLLSSDILAEKFCCDLSACKGQCCVEGDAGAPVTLDEIAEIEDCLDEVWGDLSMTSIPISSYTIVVSVLWRRLSGLGKHAFANPSVVRCIPSVRNA